MGEEMEVRDRRPSGAKGGGAECGGGRVKVCVRGGNTVGGYGGQLDCTFTP